ncbi:hypothetical protein TWF569_006362 [Orbilia oligospora]|uniref:Cell wall protein PhiA n=1 Tax=Orbilia oligospora TaxID=2813651 RepID=A0A7C8J2M8_ORBOL|nr:hypothetical protein TWF102_011882 [Orbilia oligospora]KAF3100455.1 hypothetical protein TWF103_008186 [Orbilia oligospora]KAF3110898.1 hypothetical protein TWF706_000367 [Orbilia oligospora]KAF3110899.1 hypothetical protein TWF706_000367 [Orbilia oligospora]KAF3139034.1 hypothetical protein TWF594_006791 [Orbilia oligospora]
MKFTLATLLATAVAAAPAPSNLSFTMMSLRSASPVHFGSVNASGQKFYIGLEKPSSYCPTPPVPASSCPSGKYTSVTFGSGYSSLNVAVPGGQRIYIAPDGSLSYTQAHSAYIPPGSTQDGFILGPKNKDNGLRPITHKKGGFVACPTKKNVGPWKVYVGQPASKDVPSGCATDCLGFSNQAVEFTSEQFGAWQY